MSEPKRLPQPYTQLKTSSAIIRPSDIPAQKPIKRRKLLSFEDESEILQGARITKNTLVKKDRQEPNKANSIQEQLKEQYYKQIEKLKEQLIEFEYSYWEGANVIKKMRRKKKQTIKGIIQVCRLQLIENFQNLAAVATQQLLCVIKDFIVPHQLFLYDIEVLQLRTVKRDLLLNFKDVIVKKDGKQIKMSVNVDGPFRIIQKSKYEKNKHMFPFVNWHTLDINRD